MKTRLSPLLSLAALAAATSLPGAALAQPGPPPGHRGPPREAVEACASLAAGAACGFTLDGRAVAGTCRKGPRGEGALACAPAAPPHHRPPMPPEALGACRGQAEGASCRFTHDGRALDGTCRKGPQASDPLACAPARPPMPPPPPEAFEACASLAEGAACTVDLGGHAVDGTCRSGPDGTGPLACAPDAPPPGGPGPDAP